MMKKTAYFATTLIILAMVLGIGGNRAFGAWSSIIGIPDPPFGINENAPAIPSLWTSNVNGFYYVQEGGSNSGNGYPGNPRGQIPSTLSAGSVVIVAGTYNVNHANNPITCNGTAANPVYIRGLDNTQRPTITQKWIVSGSYYVIEYINAIWANSSGNGKLNFSGDHGVVRHCDFRGDTNTGVGGVNPNGSYHVIYDCFLHDFGDVNASFDQDNHGIAIGSNTHHIWIVYNEIARCSGDGIQINAGSAGAQASTHHIYFGRNKTHHNKQTGMWCKQADDVIFSQNESYGHRLSGSSQGDGAGGQYGPTYLWVIFNDLYDNESGIRFASTSGLGSNGDRFIIGNKIHNIHKVTSAYDTSDSWESAAIGIWNSSNTYIIGNTIWDVDAGINSPSNGAFHIHNNIFDVNSVSGANQIWIYESATANASTMDYNLFMGSGRIRWGSSSTTITLSTFKSTYPTKGQHALSTSDAKFVSPGTGDFHLASGSPAIDTAAAHAAYDTFFTRYGIDIKKDLDGVVRPQGSNWDIGAYEGAGSGGPPPTYQPLAPTNLRIQ